MMRWKSTYIPHYNEQIALAPVLQSPRAPSKLHAKHPQAYTAVLENFAAVVGKLHTQT